MELKEKRTTTFYTIQVAEEELNKIYRGLRLNPDEEETPLNEKLDRDILLARAIREILREKRADNV